MMQLETKRLPLSDARVKLADDAGVMRFSGYASTFGNRDAYGDIVVSGAFKRTIQSRNRERPIRLRWNHFGPVIGKWLKFAEDETGLYVEGELTPGHSVASDVYASMKHGAVDGISIGYITRDSEVIDEGKGRLLKDIDLIEVSLVEEPANIAARVTDVKGVIDAAQSLKDIETLLREAGGFSRADATALVGRIKSLAHGERDAEAKARAEFAQLFERAAFIRPAT